MEYNICKNEIETRKKLLALLKKKGFFGFLHTTEFENFVKIFQSRNLLPREALTDFKDVADREVIEHTDEEIKGYLRFYYKEKTPTNFRAKYLEPVMLVFDPLLIFDSRAKFTDGNAASRYSIVTDQGQKALSFNWDLIFERGPYDSYYEKEKTRYRNAEFFFCDSLSIDKIVSVIFKREIAYNRAIGLLGNDERFQINAGLFD